MIFNTQNFSAVVSAGQHARVVDLTIDTLNSPRHEITLAQPTQVGPSIDNSKQVSMHSSHSTPLIEKDGELSTKKYMEKKMSQYSDITLSDIGKKEEPLLVDSTPVK